MTTIPGTVVPRRLDLRTAVVPDVPAAAGADGTEVWVIGLAGPHGMDEAFVASVLSEEEAGRAAAFHFPQDRVCYEASHVGLRLLLGARLGCPPDAVPLAREDCLGCGGPHGRPVLADGALHFSLSHTRALSLIALARRRVGVDLEAVPEPATAEAVTPRLHPTERAELAALPEDMRPAAFARVWARTEAYLKGVGIGLSRPPSLDYLGAGPTPAHPPGWTLADIPLPPAPGIPPHAAALALAHT